MDLDAVDQLSASLKAAGIHPSQIALLPPNSVTLDMGQGAIADTTPKPKHGILIRSLDMALSKVFDLLPRRTWEDRLKD